MDQKGSKRIGSYFLDVLRKLSIRRRLLIVFMVQVLMVVLLANAIIMVSYVEYETLIESNNARMISSIVENVRLSAISLDAVTKYPIIRADKPPFTYYYLSYPDFYEKQHYQYVQDVQNNAQRLLQMYPSVSNIVVYDLEGKGLYLKRNDQTVLSTTSSAENNWFENTLEQRGRLCIWGSEDFDERERFYGGDYLYATRAIVNVERISSVGLVLANTDLGANMRMFERDRVFDQQRIGVFDSQGKRIMGSLTERHYQRLLQAMQQQSSVTQESRVHGLRCEMDGQEMIYSFSDELDGYRCIIETPYSLIRAGSLKKQSVTMALFGVALLLILATTNQIVVSITKPIGRLIAATEKVREGDLSIAIADDGADELSMFTNSFNAMTRQINTLVYEVHVKEMERVDLELQMLRMQINPHFLYNSLESIRAQADSNGERELSEMSVLLGKVLRYGVTNPSDEVPLRRELENLESYMKLQRLRYGDRLLFVTNVEEPLLDLPVIKLFLQPMVENAIYHGLDTAGEHGSIHILGYREGQRMIFNVLDNGVGMDEQTVRNINAYLHGENQAFTSIGIKNVHRRIQLFYGEQYGVCIQSQFKRGTKVTITMPIRQKGVQSDGSHFGG